jgi:hypothetical protein
MLPKFCSELSHNLSITHKLGLFVNKIPSSSNVLQAQPTTPESGHSWFAIGFATEEATKLSDPTNCLADSRHRVWQSG